MKPSAIAERDSGDLVLFREHVVQVLESAPFRASRRCTDLLRFIAENALAGRTEVIKERTIGERVFGRPDYDPATENLVRVHANELRKRLAVFYQSCPEARVHIEMPAGSYVPEFHLVAVPVMARADDLRQPGGWRWLLWGAGALAAVALGWILLRPAPSALDQFWAPATQGAAPLLISNPPSNEASRYVIMAFPEMAAQLRAGRETIAVPARQIVERYDLVSGGNVDALVAIAMLLKERHNPPEVRIAADLGPGDFQSRPLIHVGFNNLWAKDVNQSLRFRFDQVTRNGQQVVVVADSQGKVNDLAVPLARPEWVGGAQEYAIISRLFNRSTGHVNVAIGGVTHLGTRAAGEFVTSPAHMAELAKTAPAGWQNKNLQVVLEVKIVGKTPGPPRIVAAHYW
jgi:hypothetical protein